MKWKIFLLIAVISFAVYFNSFQNSFHFDDQHFVVENTYIRDIGNIPSFFISPTYLSFEKGFTSHYRPLLITSYAINYSIGGLKPAGYHAVNLLFHVGSAFLVFLIVNAMLVISEQLAVSRKQVASNRFKGLSAHSLIALATALVFTVHPFNSEVVNYITARSSVMCAFFYLLSFYMWVKYRKAIYGVSGEQSAVRSKQAASSGFQGFPAHCSLFTAHFYYTFSFLSFILAMLTKEIAITLPAVLFLYDFYYYKRRPPNCYLSYLPYIFLIIVPYLAYRIMIYGSIAGSSARPYLSNIITQSKVLVKYIQLMFFPAGLTIEHDIRLIENIFDLKVILSLLFLIVVLVIAYILFRKGGEWRLLSFFILWFFVTLIPTTVIPLNAILQENRGYLGGIVFALTAGIVISRIKGKALTPALVVLIIVLSFFTVQRNIVWRSDLSLWNDAMAKSPVSARAHDNLGLAYMGIKKYDLALEEFNKTLEINPRYYLAYYNAGVIYQLQGDLGRARWAYEESLKISPSYFRSYYNLGIVYKKMGDMERSAGAYEKAIAIDPRHTFVYNNLGVVLTEQGDLKRAEAVFMQAISINPGYDKAYYNLGNVYFRSKEYGKAAESYRAAIRINPGYREADRMLRESLARL